MDEPSLEGTQEYDAGFSAEYRSEYYEDVNPKLSLKKVVEEVNPSYRKSRVICTLGPSCNNTETMIQMLENGMDFARVNLSHGDYKSNRIIVDKFFDALNQRPNIQCGLMFETRGPQILLGKMKNSVPVEVSPGQQLEISTDYTHPGDNIKVGCSLRQLPSIVRIGEIVYLGEGMACEVRDAFDGGIVVEIKTRGFLKDNTRVYLPQAKLDLSPITERDEKDIAEFASNYNFDILVVSGLRKDKDIEYVRYILKENNKEGVHVYIKIDNHEALFNYEKILASADGIIICRTPLATEISGEKIFVAQKWMIEKANQSSKPILVMNEIFESMVKNYTPARHETSDVSMAIIDGADGIVLQKETAVGEFPVESIVQLSKVAAKAESIFDNEEYYKKQREALLNEFNELDAQCATALELAKDNQIELIVVFSQSGDWARSIAKYKPRQMILACTIDSTTVKQLSMHRGITSYKIPSFFRTHNLLDMVVSLTKELGVAEEGTKILAIQGDIDSEDVEQKEIIKMITV